VSSSWEMGEHFPTGPGTVPANLPDVELIWVTCGWCWGQRQTWHDSGMGYVAEACPACMGLGETGRQK
jgi:hypothetical protein